MIMPHYKEIIIALYIITLCFVALAFKSMDDKVKCCVYTILAAVVQFISWNIPVII